MRPFSRLGQVNLALVALYFVPAWGHDALSALTSPYSGFEDPAHTAAAVYFRKAVDLDPGRPALRHRLGTALFLTGDVGGASAVPAGTVARLGLEVHLARCGV